jgi:hypothetical protein
MIMYFAGSHNYFNMYNNYHNQPLNVHGDNDVGQMKCIQLRHWYLQNFLLKLISYNQVLFCVDM